MTDESITIPDFLPVDLEDEHVIAARDQVEQSRARNGQHAEARAAEGRAPARVRRPRTASHKRRATVVGHGPGTGPVSWLPASEIPLVTAAVMIGLVGMCGLTTWWSWLAVTQDPMWWGFTAAGGVLLGALAWAIVAVQAHGRRLAAGSGDPDDVAPDDVGLDDVGVEL